MGPSVWVPLSAALIAAVTTLVVTRVTTRVARATSEANADLKRVELALSGMTTLLAQVQEDRQLCWRLLGEARDDLEKETRHRRKG